MCSFSCLIFLLILQMNLISHNRYCQTALLFTSFVKWVQHNVCNRMLPTVFSLVINPYYRYQNYRNHCQNTWPNLPNESLIALQKSKRLYFRTRCCNILLTAIARCLHLWMNLHYRNHCSRKTWLKLMSQICFIKLWFINYGNKPLLNSVKIP